MKTLSNLLLGLFASISAFSQDYIPLPLEDGMWFNYCETYNDNGIVSSGVDRYCASGVEILNNGLTYYEINDCLSGDDVAALRDDDGRVYAIIPDYGTDEVLLYDFTVEVGDIVTNVYPTMSDFEVSAVGSTEIDGVMRKTISFLNSDEEDQWIEGIGSTSGLFQGPGSLFLSGFCELRCMSSGDSTLYPSVLDGPCDLTFGLKKDLQKALVMEVFPNPSAGDFTISLDQSISSNQVSVFNSSGSQINPSITGKNGSLELNMHEYPAGIYSVTCILNASPYTKRIIKVE